MTGLSRTCLRYRVLGCKWKPSKECALLKVPPLFDMDVNVDTDDTYIKKKPYGQWKSRTSLMDTMTHVAFHVRCSKLDSNSEVYQMAIPIISSAPP